METGKKTHMWELVRERERAEGVQKNRKDLVVLGVGGGWRYFPFFVFGPKN